LLVAFAPLPTNAVGPASTLTPSRVGACLLFNMG
jgi:hypothetical protein